MGLFKFLKEKFGKKNNDAVEKKEEQVADFKNEETPAEVILETEVKEEKPVIKETPKVEEVKPESVKEEPVKPEKKVKESKKETKETSTYIKGMEKSRENFANKIEKLSKKYKKVNQEYFEQLEEILNEAI